MTATDLYRFAETFPLPTLPQRGASIFIKIIPPQDTKPAIFQAFLEVLGDVKRAVTFEIVAEAGRIYFQFVCSANDQKFIEQQLQVHFPECSTVIQKAATPITLHTLYAVPSSSVFENSPLHPYSQLFAQISNLPPNEGAYVRMNFAPASRQGY